MAGTNGHPITRKELPIEERMMTKDDFRRAMNILDDMLNYYKQCGAQLLVHDQSIKVLEER